MKKRKIPISDTPVTDAPSGASTPSQDTSAPARHRFADAAAERLDVERVPLRQFFHDYRALLLRLALAVGVVAVLVAVLVRQIKHYVYTDRQEMYTLVARTAADIVNQNSSMEWVVADRTCLEVMHSLHEAGDIDEGIQHVTAYQDYGRSYFFLVDDMGRYWCSDGFKGRVNNRNMYYPTSPDRGEYLATLPHRDPDDVYMIYRQRVPDSLSVCTDDGVTLRYFAYAQELAPLISKVNGLLSDETNVFLYDSHGAMVHKSLAMGLLLDGLNIFPKFAQCTYPYGENADTLLSRARHREPLVVDLVIGEREFFFCSYPVEVSDWSLAFITDSSSHASMSSEGWMRIVLYIGLLMLVVSIGLVAIVLGTMRQRTSLIRLRDSERVSDAMASASKAKTDFLSNMSHDIRTPINGIVGVATIARGCVDNPTKIRECLDKIDGASQHLLSLINDVLDMSRIESGKTIATYAPADIRTLCDNCASIVRGQLVGRDITFTADVDVRHPAVLADELHLRQVLINILSNAIKFTRDGGTIRFRCTETASDDTTATFRFECEDSGIGMSPEFLGHIFEAFSQEQNRGRSQYKGTGLGMAISKQLTELMGGTIEVASELGKGSLFTVTVPCTIDHTVHTADTVDADVPDIEGTRILLVEDNDLNLEIATELLGVIGAVITPAVDGQEALEIFSSSAPGTYDVILMDVMMPRMNGLEATRAIRALPRDDAQRIPIIAMTANAFDDDVRATREAGMDAHLSKPIDIQEVVRTIAHQLRRAQQTPRL